jgi:hypothetical protein
MPAKVDIGKIAAGLGAERRGKLAAKGGHFGALQIVAEVQARFKTPVCGGRATNPDWTTRRLLPLADRTLTRLEQLAHEIARKRNLHVEPMQLAALLLERSLQTMTEEESDRIAKSAAAVG